MYGEYEDSVLKKLHDCEMEILKDFISVCEKNNIEYFAISGTAIGALRHQGFIPWDDDIDIAMLREDYVRFIKAARKDKAIMDKYEFWGPDMKKKYYNLQPIMVRKNTVFVNENAAAGGYRPGIFMDIFIYDHIPENKEEADKIIKKCRKYKILYLTRNINYFKLLKNQTTFQKFKNIILGFTRLFMKLFPDIDRVIYKKFYECATSYKGTSDKYTCLFDPGSEIMHIWKSKSYPTIKKPFEDIEIRMVKNYDEQLRTHMGEYMTLPPENKRTNHFPVELDFGDM
ncbi:MAG: LicD family protein [Lachnospiraceae bacterium]|nr:LicD family protein [Lachnospiraceae bacterium]